MHTLDVDIMLVIIMISVEWNYFIVHVAIRIISSSYCHNFHRSRIYNNNWTHIGFSQKKTALKWTLNEQEPTRLGIKAKKAECYVSSMVWSWKRFFSWWKVSHKAQRHEESVTYAPKARGKYPIGPESMKKGWK